MQGEGAELRGAVIPRANHQIVLGVAVVACVLGEVVRRRTLAAIEIARRGKEWNVDLGKVGFVRHLFLTVSIVGGVRNPFLPEWVGRSIDLIQIFVWTATDVI